MFLKAAEVSLKANDPESGWHHLNQARGELIGTYDLARLRLVAQSLLAEIAMPGRLPPTCAEEIKRLLADAGYLRGHHRSPGDAKPDSETIRAAIVAAARLRYEGQAHQYWQLSVVRHFQRMILLIGAPVVAGAIFLMLKDSDRIARNEGWAVTGSACLLTILLGILGAITSAAQRSTRVREDHISLQLGSHVNSFSRLPIGAVAGLTVWLFTLATVEGGTVNGPNLLLAAFGAGFAERLIVQGQPGPARDSAPGSRPGTGR